MIGADGQLAQAVGRPLYTQGGLPRQQCLNFLPEPQGQGSLRCGRAAGGASGGIAATGNYPGRARTADELRRDLDVALGLIPGKKKLNLHASYASVGVTCSKKARSPSHR